MSTSQHSLYGWSEMKATALAQREATGGKRGAIISRSTFPSSGQYGGHWLGDNEAKWPDLRLSIIGIQEFNMFGLPHVGADVCGFELDTNEVGNNGKEKCPRNNNTSKLPKWMLGIVPALATAGRLLFILPKSQQHPATGSGPSAMAIGGDSDKRFLRVKRKFLFVKIFKILKKNIFQ